MFVLQWVSLMNSCARNETLRERSAVSRNDRASDRRESASDKRPNCARRTFINAPVIRWKSSTFFVDGMSSMAIYKSHRIRCNFIIKFEAGIATRRRLTVNICVNGMFNRNNEG